MREWGELRAVRMVVVRGSVRGRVIGGADLLLGMIQLVIVLIAVIEMNLAAERYSRVISYQPVLSLIHNGDCGLRNKGRRQRHAQRDEERPQLCGSQR